MEISKEEKLNKCIVTYKQRRRCHLCFRGGFVEVNEPSCIQGFIVTVYYSFTKVKIRILRSLHLRT
jgi:hypothetical protein